MEDKLTKELKSCEAEARKQGWRGEWAPTQEDCSWIVSHLGRKPTQDEWAAAGYPHVGAQHITEKE